MHEYLSYLCNHANGTTRAMLNAKMSLIYNWEYKHVVKLIFECNNIISHNSE